MLEVLPNTEVVIILQIYQINMLYTLSLYSKSIISS